MVPPNRTITDLLMDFEAFLRQKGMPRAYVPAYTIIALDLIRTDGLATLEEMTVTEVTEYIARTAPDYMSPTTLSNRQKVARALVRYLAERSGGTI